MLEKRNKRGLIGNSGNICRKKSYMSRWIYTFCIIVVLLCFMIDFWRVGKLPGEADLQSGKSTLEPATIVYAIDGDTVIVNRNGKDIRVRLIGVNTPESVSRTEENTEEGYIASEFTKGYLQKGQTVWLEYDIQRTDKYGRTLVYIWLTDQVDCSSYDDFCTYNYGAILLQNTYCEAKGYLPNIKYRSWYERLETE